ncbi:mucin-5AC-like [Armigeres subalbatus]|uniref:mucin-5AC-like n=1 Tax=Armigeres subalbatus TaxID=124917 RepID=UPI002ED2D453
MPDVIEQESIGKSSAIYQLMPMLDDNGLLRERDRIGAVKKVCILAKGNQQFNYYPMKIPAIDICTFTRVFWPDYIEYYKSYVDNIIAVGECPIEPRQTRVNKHILDAKMFPPYMPAGLWKLYVNFNNDADVKCHVSDIQLNLENDGSMLKKMFRMDKNVINVNHKTEINGDEAIKYEEKSKIRSLKGTPDTEANISANSPLLGMLKSMQTLQSSSDAVEYEINDSSLNVIPAERFVRQLPPEVSQDSLLQLLGTQIANALESNSGQQIQNITSQIATGFSNVTNQVAEGFSNATNSITSNSDINASLQSQLLQLINSLGTAINSSTSQSDSPTKVVSQDSIFQQIGSQLSNAATNATSSGINLLQPIGSQVQNVTNQLTGAIPNAANISTITTGSEIQNQLLQLINSLGINTTNAINQQSDSKPSGVSQDSIFSQIVNSASSALGSLATQFQNASAQAAAGLTNVSNSITDSINSASSSGSDPLSVITSQIGSVGAQITGGISNVTNAIAESNLSVNNSTILTALQNQLETLLNSSISNTTTTTTESSTDTSSSTSTTTTGASNDPIFLAPFQTISTSLSNATSGLIPNISSETFNQIVDALKPSAIQGQLQGIGSQLEANIPIISNDEGILSTISQNILNWNNVNNLLLPSNLLSSTNNNVNPAPLPLMCPDCTPSCGKTNPEARVAGGTLLSPTNTYPWTARILYFGTDIGQGTLINDRAVITTATIIRTIPIYSAVTVLFNVFDKSSTTEQRLERNAINVFTPKLYNPANIYDFNIGIIRLATPVTLTSTFMPICLPKYYDSIGGTSGSLIGWGAQTLTGQTSDTPREVSIPLYTDRECQLSNSNLTTNNLCGGVVKPAPTAAIKATCKGDDGAALMYPSRTDATVLTLLGVAIDVPGQGCGETNQLSVFSKVYNNLDFIVLYGAGCGC